MTTFEQILTFLDGRKAIIVSVIAVTVSFMAQQGKLDAQTATYINTVIGILFGYAEIKTPGTLGARRK